MDKDTATKFINGLMKLLEEHNEELEKQLKEAEYEKALREPYDVTELSKMNDEYVFEMRLSNIQFEAVNYAINYFLEREE